MTKVYSFEQLTNSIELLEPSPVLLTCSYNY